MIASLYQSGSSSCAALAGTAASAGLLTTLHLQHMTLTNLRIEPHVVPLAAPCEDRVVGQEIPHLVFAGPAERSAHESVLRVIGIDADHDEDPAIVAIVRRRPLAEGDDLRVVG